MRAVKRRKNAFFVLFFEKCNIFLKLFMLILYLVGVIIIVGIGLFFDLS